MDEKETKNIQDIQELIINNLERIKRGGKMGYVVASVLRNRNLIKPKYERVPFVDNPSKTTRIFTGWELTPKGKKFLRVWKNREMYLD